MTDQIVFITREKEEPLEADIQEDIRKYLKTRPGWKGYKASDRYKKGVSDIIGCLYGFFVAIEVKRNAKATVSKHQYDFLREVKEMGGFGTIVWSVEMVEDFLNNIEHEFSQRTNGLYKTFLKE